MSLITRFFRKQKEEKLEKQAENQKNAAEKTLELAKKTKTTKTSVAKKNDTKKIEKVKIETKIEKKRMKAEVYRVLLKPLITEKISDMAVLGKYAFQIKMDANKIMVKKAVSALYGVKVRDVRIVNVLGKSVRYGRHTGKRSDWKKAIVTLAPGEKLEIYEGV